MRWLAVIAVAALAFAACNGGSVEGDIGDTIAGFYHALDEDPPRAYTYLSQSCKEQVDYSQFFGALSFILGRGFLGEGALEVRDLEITTQDGDDSLEASFHVVIISDGEEIELSQGFAGGEEPTRFIREDGRWRFRDCEGFAGGEEGGEAEPAPAPTPRSSLVAAQEAETDNDPALPGEWIDLASLYGEHYPDTADHVQEQVDYSAQGLPPAGGPHWSNGVCGDDATSTREPFCGPVLPGIYTVPWEAESLVHSMEHAALVIWYNTTDRAVVDDLEALVAARSDQYLVLTPYPDMGEEQVALTAWSRRDTFPAAEYDRARVERFIDAHYCRFDPEDFCG